MERKDRFWRWINHKNRKPEVAPVLKKPLFNAIKITPARTEKFIIVSNDDAGEECFAPHPYTAQLSVYDIELSPGHIPEDAKAREELRSTLERSIRHVRSTEKFMRYERGGPSHVMAEGEPPVYKISGLSLDELGGLIKYNILESNIKVAHVFAGAAREEYRGPLMTLGSDEPGEGYDSHPGAHYYRRNNMSTQSANSIGDLGAAPPGEEYQHAVNSLRQGLARDHIRGKEHFARAASFIAFATLKGLLPSPYPTEVKLLTDGRHTDDAAGKKQMMGERVEQVVSDVFGPDQKLVWDSRQARRGVKVRGQPQEATLGEHAKRLKKETEDRIQRDDVPAWFLGTKEEWKTNLRESFAAAQASMQQRLDELDVRGGLKALIKEMDGQEVLTEKKIGELRLKGEIRDRLKKSSTTRSIVPAEMSHAIQSWDDAAFIGVQHRLRVFTYYGNLTNLDYETRNPLIDPRRKIPRPLEELLKREGKRERLRLPGREHDVGGQSAAR